MVEVSADRYAGAVIVSTPQDIALKDAVKGISMFRKVDVSMALHFLTAHKYIAHCVRARSSA
jgi:hypothetical protein